MATAIAHQSADVIAWLSDALAEANAHHWNSEDDQTLLAALADAPGLRNQLDALIGQIAVAAETRGAVLRAGARKASIWVGANTNGSPAAIRADVRVTRWLVDYAEFRDAYEAGVLSRRHVDLLRGAERPATRLALLRDQAMLIGFAEKLSFDDFGRALQYWVNAADPDGTIPDDQVAKSRITMRRRSDGSGTVEADLDPMLMTLWHEAVERELKKLRAHDHDTDIRRTPNQLMLAAHAALLERGAARSDGSTGNPLIKIVMGEKLAEQLLLADADPDPDTPVTPSFFDPDYRCEFLDGTPLHPKLAKQLLGVAEFRRMILTADPRDLDISVNTRAFPQWMRDGALVLTRGRCIETGCDTPFHWLHADHRKPRAKGGQTSFRNLDPYCGEGNRAKSDTWTPPQDPDDDTDSPAA